MESAYARSPRHEEERLEALVRYGILDTARDEAFDRITALAADLLQVPIALITLVDQKRQWFKSAHGLAASSTPREGGFCAYTVSCEAPAVITDASVDVRFAAHPMVVGEPHIRLYAGAPLVTHDGYVLGTLCVIDSEARAFEDRQLQLLTTLAAVVMDQIETRYWAHLLSKEEARRMQRELELSASRAAAAELRQLAIRSADLDRAKMSFLTTASNELRTPLTIISGYLEMLDEPAFAAREEASAAARRLMRSKAAEMNDVIDRMLRMAELNATPGADEDVDLFELLRSTVAEARELAPRGNFLLVTPEADVRVRGDRLRLGLVFESLLDNAARFSDSGSVVRCEVSLAAGMARVEIVDQGVGATDGDVGGGGRGLGQFLARDLVVAHGGTFELERSESGGTAAVVSLPARRHRPQRAEGATRDPAQLSSREMEVARLAALGHTNQSIANLLFLSSATVATHIAHVLAKRGFRSRAQIATWIADVDREKSSDLRMTSVSGIVDADTTDGAT